MPRKIKKYKNRRLYDVEKKSYINLSDLIALVQSGEDIVVCDAKTMIDITQSVLLQALGESGGASLLPVPLLCSMIRLQAESPMQAMMIQQLKTSMSLLSMQLESLERNNPWRGIASKQHSVEEGAEVEQLRARLAQLEKRFPPDR